MQHWHDDHEEPMPGIFKKFDELTSRQVASQSRLGGTVTHVQPGAGSHEPSFRKYWLISAWSFLTYQGLAMGVVIGNMVMGVNNYLWIPHVVGTIVIVFGTGFMACIYRFILFPQPTYYSSMPNVSQHTGALTPFRSEAKEAAA
jgi:hypothetical protein